MKRKPKALVVGAPGVVGRNFLQMLNELADWDAIGLSRRAAAGYGRFPHVSLDLLDVEATMETIGAISGITHVFYVARVLDPDPAREAAVNLRMLVNTMDAVETVSGNSLAHVNLVHGTKWYGSHLGPYKTPARETDPRHMPPNFYYDQQDHIEARQKGKSWTWSALRPHIVCGFASGVTNNLLTLIAAYALICKELGLPLRFPGSPDCYDSISQATDVGMLNKAMLWASTTPACANEAFNIVNDDYFRWVNLWPRIGAFFDMEVGPVQQICLAEFMADKADLWNRIVAKHDLKPTRLADLAHWPFGDFVFAASWDDLSSMVKARKYGFTEAVDTEDGILKVLAQFRAERIIP